MAAMPVAATQENWTAFERPWPHYQEPGIYAPLEKSTRRMIRFNREKTTVLELHFDLEVYHDIEGIQTPIRSVSEPSKNKEYYALSYTWQPEQPKQTILLNGVPCEVGHNLYHFLRTLSRMTGQELVDRLWWIDAICINQADMEEKSEEVLRMGMIFRYCTKLFVWLGDRPETVGNVRQMRENISWENIMLLQDEPYFSRLWIVQEFILCRVENTDIHLMSYGDTVLASDVASFMWHTKRSPSDPRPRQIFIDLFLYPIAPFTRSLWIIAAREERSTLSLIQSIHLFGGQICREPRDKVFGFVGFLEKYDLPDIDYMDSVVEVYCEAIVATMNSRDPRKQQFTAKQHVHSTATLAAEYNGIKIDPIQVLLQLSEYMDIRQEDSQGLELFLRAVYRRATWIRFWKRLGFLQDAYVESIRSCDSLGLVYRSRGKWYSENRTPNTMQKMLLHLKLAWDMGKEVAYISPHLQHIEDIGVRKSSAQEEDELRRYRRGIRYKRTLWQKLRDRLR